MTDNTSSNLSQKTPSQPQQLDEAVEAILNPLGYELVALEITSAGGRKVVVYIDFLENSTEDATKNPAKRISLEDCLTANRALDPFFETTELITGAFDLEVSSPGVERPLKKPEHFVRFKGQKAQISTFAPLSSNELENDVYLQKNIKQKKFIGTILDFDQAANKVLIEIPFGGIDHTVKIPLKNISKAHLEFDFNQSNHK